MQGPTGRVFSVLSVFRSVLKKKLGSGGFSSGRSVEIFEQVFLSTLPTLGFFWVLWVFQIFSFFGGSEPIDMESYA